MMVMMMAIVMMMMSLDESVLPEFTEEGDSDAPCLALLNDDDSGDNDGDDDD